MKKLIVTADDFGISKEVNEAVESAHKNGILTATSLMVGEPFAADAVARARRLPTLGVGLHIALSRAHPVSDPKTIPALVDQDGMLSADLVGAGFRFFLWPPARRQLRQEITAQFEAFAKTGLPLDHVNVHNHLHLHPTILGQILDVGRQYGMASIRLPNPPEPKKFSTRCLAPWLSLMKYRLRKNAIKYNDVFLGFEETGSLDTASLVAMIERLTDQTTELMCHPATGPWAHMDPMAKGFCHDQELQALIDPAVSVKVRENNIKLVTFRDVE